MTNLYLLVGRRKTSVQKKPHNSFISSELTVESRCLRQPSSIFDYTKITDDTRILISPTALCLIKLQAKLWGWGERCASKHPELTNDIQSLLESLDRSLNLKLARALYPNQSLINEQTVKRLTSAGLPVCSFGG